MKPIRFVLPAVALLFLSMNGNRAMAADGPSLFLLSGTIMTGVSIPFSLYSVNSSSPSHPSLVFKVSDGSEWVSVDYDRGIAVVGSPVAWPKDFAVIDMSAPSKATTVHIPYDDHDLIPIGFYLLDLPGRGEAVAAALAHVPLVNIGKDPFVAPRGLNTVFLEGPLNPATTLPLGFLRFVRVSGKAGGGLPGMQHLPEVRGDPLHILVADRKGWSTDLPRPSYFQTDPNTEVYLLAVNNDAIAVLTPFGDSSAGPIDIYNKHTKEWHRALIPWDVTCVRAFGPWIAAMTAETASPLLLPAGPVAKFTPKKTSGPGALKREEEIILPKLSVEGLFSETSLIFPGELVLYNAFSRATIKIKTGEADSEVLLVTDAAVFYRVNDVLYRCPLNGSALGESVVLASGDEIVQAHWAFLASAPSRE
jgi:hypothetical protein